MALHLDGSKLFWHLDRVAEWRDNKEIFPVHVEISPTSKCNYRCIFCYADYAGHKSRIIPREVYLNLLRDMGNAGVRSCLLAGDGEPLVHPNTVEAIALGKESGLDMALNTNGFLLDPKTSESVLPHLEWLRISVMAKNPDIYGFLHGVPSKNVYTVLKNIESAATIKSQRNLKVTIGLQQVLLPENGEEAPMLARWAKEAGLDYYVLKPFSLHAGNSHYKDGVSAIFLRDKFREYLLKAEQESCSSFQSIIRWNTFLDDGEKEYKLCLGLPFIAQVGADSKIYTCCPYFYNDNFAYGDLVKSSFNEIWMSDYAVSLRRQIAQTFDVSKCMTYCRHHQINKQLWQLKNPPQHINFI